MTDKQELIDLYHSGNMSPEQMVDFEKQLESNPELKTESNFQSDIINGLKEVRKAELKSRLNAIDVSSGWMEFVQQSALVKSFGGVAVATLIGSGVYMFAEKQEIATEQQVAIEISAPQPQEEEFTIDLDLTSKEVLNPKAIEEFDSKAKVISDQSVVNEVVADKKTGTILEESPKAVVPNFNAPSANLVEDENRFESSNLDELPDATTAVEKEIDVSTENVKSLKVRYKYYDGKLFLSGDFDRAPYEILEINSATGRRIYIQYLDKYYQVKTTDKLSDLPEVENQKLIQELKLLKDNK